MKIVITGGGGMIGQKLAHRLLAEKRCDKLVLFDAVAPQGPDDPRVERVTGDITDPALVQQVISPDVDGVFHLAAVVSAGAEADFDLGWRVNLEGTRHVLEAARAAKKPPRLVFASTAAVYGGDIPDTVVDATPLTPQTSYGSQKACGELLVNDYSRKGYIDGRSLRLPTIVVRPGKPNKAASGFASSIVREPLNGIDFECPVTPESCMALMSPRRVVEAFIRMFELDAGRLGAFRSLLLPGIRVSMAEAKAALDDANTNRKKGRITFKVDPAIQKIVDGWPKEMRADRARALGFVADRDMAEIVQTYIEDDFRPA